MARLTDFQINQVIRETEREVEKRMKKAVMFLEGQTKRLVSRGNRTGTNPSRPGEPPKVVSGTLRSNIGHEVRKEGRTVVGAVGVRMGPADKYAMRLELGFRGTDSKGRNVRQEERPYLRAALEQNKAKVARILETGG